MQGLGPKTGHRDREKAEEELCDVAAPPSSPTTLCSGNHPRPQVYCV